VLMGFLDAGDLLEEVFEIERRLLELQGVDVDELELVPDNLFTHLLRDLEDAGRFPDPRNPRYVKRLTHPLVIDSLINELDNGLLLGITEADFVRE